MAGTLDGKNIQTGSIPLDRLTPEPLKSSDLTNLTGQLSANHTHDHTTIIRTALDADTLDGHDVVMGLTDVTPTHLITNEYLQAYMESLDLNFGPTLEVVTYDWTAANVGDYTIDPGHNIAVNTALSRPLEAGETLKVYADQNDSAPAYTWTGPMTEMVLPINNVASSAYRTAVDTVHRSKSVFTPVTGDPIEQLGNEWTLTGQPNLSLTSITAVDQTDNNTLLDYGHTKLVVTANFTTNVGGETLTLDSGVPGVAALTLTTGAGLTSSSYIFDIPETARHATDTLTYTATATSGSNSVSCTWTISPAAAPLNSGPYTIDTFTTFSNSIGWW